MEIERDGDENGNLKSADPMAEQHSPVAVVVNGEPTVNSVAEYNESVESDGVESVVRPACDERCDGKSKSNSDSTSSQSTVVEQAVQEQERTTRTGNAVRKSGGKRREKDAKFEFATPGREERKDERREAEWCSERGISNMSEQHHGPCGK